jgi:LPXTG-motif cell wall-anchored protein
MALDDTDLGNDEADETPPAEGSSNRTFLIVAGILGGVMLLALLCLGLYALFFAPQRRAQNATQVAQINSQNTQIAEAAAMTAQAAKWTATPTATRIPPSATVTPTQVVAESVEPTEVAGGAGTPDPRTATVAALLTQAAGGGTPDPRTATAAARLTATATASGLPQTGFAEDVGVPGLVGLALALVAVIFLARRFRSAS